jgi:hypothetical protein
MITYNRMLKELEILKHILKDAPKDLGRINYTVLFEDIIKFLREQEQLASIGLSVRGAFNEGYKLQKVIGAERVDCTYDNYYLVCLYHELGELDLLNRK